MKTTEFTPGYTISEDGTLISLNYRRTGASKELSQQTRQGYKRVRVLDRMLNIHRLVAEAFVPNPSGKPQVNHKDGDKSNNSYLNLEWVTASENVQHAFDTGLKVQKSGAGHQRAVRVKCIDTGVVYGSISDATRALSLTKGEATCISRVCRGNAKATRGLRWEYV